MRLSIVRLLTTRISTRSQKSCSDVKAPSRSRSSTIVSISQLRYLSFQVTKHAQHAKQPLLCFNLTIEILIFSSQSSFALLSSRRICFNLTIEILIFSRTMSPFAKRLRRCLVSISQLRYLSFQEIMVIMATHYDISFNLTIEILIFSSGLPSEKRRNKMKFQSHN